MVTVLTILAVIGSLYVFNRSLKTAIREKFYSVDTSLCIELVDGRRWHFRKTLQCPFPPVLGLTVNVLGRESLPITELSVTPSDSFRGYKSASVIHARLETISVEKELTVAGLIYDALDHHWEDTLNGRVPFPPEVEEMQLNGGPILGIRD